MSGWFKLPKISSLNIDGSPVHPRIFVSFLEGMSDRKFHQGFSQLNQAGSVRGRDPNSMLIGVSGNMCFQAFMRSSSNHPMMWFGLALISLMVILSILMILCL